MFQENEIVNLLLVFASVPVLFFLSRKVRIPAGGLLYLSFGLVLVAYVFTVAEGVLWHDGFNVLEHLSEALAGLGFLAYAWRLSHLPSPRDPKQ